MVRAFWSRVPNVAIVSHTSHPGREGQPNPRLLATGSGGPGLEGAQGDPSAEPQAGKHEAAGTLCHNRPVGHPARGHTCRPPARRGDDSVLAAWAGRCLGDDAQRFFHLPVQHPKTEYSPKPTFTIPGIETSNTPNLVTSGLEGYMALRTQSLWRLLGVRRGEVDLARFV